jgi:indole-3-glycerol phosphate synthase
VSRLEEIVASKRRELETLRPQRDGTSPAPPERGRNLIERRRTPLDTTGALMRHEGEPLRLLTEVKLKSPSAGALSRALAPDARALAYARAGAAMVSVLCDAPFFDGSWDHVSDARRALDEAGLRVPLLAKEFVIDPRQITVAREYGADSILLIARIVDAKQLAELVRAARHEGLEPLVEVVDEAELRAGLDAGARVVGVNARDLDTLAMDAERAVRVLGAIPRDVVAVHLSGLKTPEDIARVAAGRADAALVGEALMRQDDPREMLGEMVRASEVRKRE